MSNEPDNEDEVRVLALAAELGFGRFLRAFHNLVRRGKVHSHADGIVVNTWDERATPDRVT